MPNPRNAASVPVREGEWRGVVLSSDISRIDTEEARRLESMATPGPWRGVRNTGYVYGPECVTAKCGDFTDKELLPFNGERWGNDAEFIAYARQALPAAIAEIEELRAVIDNALHGLREPLTLDDARHAKAILVRCYNEWHFAEVRARRARTATPPTELELQRDTIHYALHCNFPWTELEQADLRQVELLLEQLASGEMVLESAEEAEWTDDDNTVLQVLCRVFDDGVDVALPEWREWYKPSEWLGFSRGLGAFIRTRLMRLAKESPPHPPTKTEVERVQFLATRAQYPEAKDEIADIVSRWLSPSPLTDTPEGR